MRSAAIVFALLIGTAVAAIATVDGKRFFNGNNMASAPAFTFLWVKRFPLGEVQRGHGERSPAFAWYRSSISCILMNEQLLLSSLERISFVLQCCSAQLYTETTAQHRCSDT